MSTSQFTTVVLTNVKTVSIRSLGYDDKPVGPVRESPALRAPAHFSIAAPRSDPFLHQRSALQPSTALRALPYITINAPRSGKTHCSALQ